MSNGVGCFDILLDKCRWDKKAKGEISTHAAGLRRRDIFCFREIVFFTFSSCVYRGQKEQTKNNDYIHNRAWRQDAGCAINQKWHKTLCAHVHWHLNDQACLYPLSKPRTRVPQKPFLCFITFLKPKCDFFWEGTHLQLVTFLKVKSKKCFKLFPVASKSQEITRNGCSDV